MSNNWFHIDDHWVRIARVETGLILEDWSAGLRRFRVTWRDAKGKEKSVYVNAADEAEASEMAREYIGAIHKRFKPTSGPELADTDRPGEGRRMVQGDHHYHQAGKGKEARIYSLGPGEILDLARTVAAGQEKVTYNSKAAQTLRAMYNDPAHRWLFNVTAFDQSVRQDVAAHRLNQRPDWDVRLRHYKGLRSQVRETETLVRESPALQRILAPSSPTQQAKAPAGPTLFPGAEGSKSQRAKGMPSVRMPRLPGKRVTPPAQTQGELPFGDG